MRFTLASFFLLILIQFSAAQVEERISEVLEGFSGISENELEALIETIEDSLNTHSCLEDTLFLVDPFKFPVKISVISTYWRNFEESIGFSQEILDGGFTGKQYGLRNRCLVSGINFRIKSISESDPGESNGFNMDHRSLGIEIRPSRERFRIFFGDYNILAGMGLGISTRPVFNSWKGEPITMTKKRTIIETHGGANENSFFRGGAAEIYLQKFKAIVFCSGIDRDGIIKTSVDGEDYFHGLYSSGLHRTNSELLRKDVVYEELGGIVVEFAAHRFEIGTVFTSFNFSENLMLPQSNKLFVGDPDYKNSARRVSSYTRGLIANGMFTGEISISGNQRSALLLSYTKFERKGLSYMISLSNYNAGFFSHDTSVSPSLFTNRTSNEGRINVLFRPGRKWGTQADIRIDGINNAAFDKDASSVKFRSFFFYDLDLLRIENHFQFQQGNIRYSFRIRAKDIDKPFYWQGEIGVSSKHFQSLIRVPGSYISMRGRYVLDKPRINIQGGVSLFTSSSGNPAFYTYEPDVLYGMSLPALSGTGSRVFMLFNYNFLKSFSLQLKLAKVDYDDRDEIGSGNDRIPTNHRTSIKVQLVYRSQN